MNWVAPIAASISAVAVCLVVRKLILKLAAAYEGSFDPPQAILVLGGDHHREYLAAKFSAGTSSRVINSSSHAINVKLLPVYVSSGHDDAARVMRRGGVHQSRLHVDNRALDTVTNFTSLVRTFCRQGYSHIFVVTSDYHLERACMLASLILCSNGLAFTSVALPSGESHPAPEPETRLRRERDRVRSILWLLTGLHGAELLRFTKPTRYRLHKQKEPFPTKME